MGSRDSQIKIPEAGLKLLAKLIARSHLARVEIGGSKSGLKGYEEETEGNQDDTQEGMAEG